MNATDWIGLVGGVFVPVLAALFGIRWQIRRAEVDRVERTKQDTRQAVLDAVEPVAEQRDYARAQLRDALRRIEQLEDQLRLRSRDDRP